ncbi:MAG: adenine deaminase [Gemmatimonadota bacterium]|nr:MAG: adenine deaminase [Gemmatimonadota bacterium]
MSTAGKRTGTDISVEDLKRRITVARGDEPGDLLLKNARLVDVFCGEVRESHVVVSGAFIAGIGESYTEGKQVLDLQGKYLLPGFIDGHVHVESSHVTLSEFARAVVPRGTTAVVIDPHEIANVLGLNGIEYMLKASEGIPLDVFVMVPSCVPATLLETAGASLGEDEIAQALKYDRVLGLGEMMNFPGVIFGTPEVLGKLVISSKSGVVIDGHAPRVAGPELNAYVTAGIGSDHECTTREEAEAKLRLGMRLMIREGSAAKNLAELLPVINASTSRRCLFVTDDRHPEDLRVEGHMDHILQKAVSLGLDPVMAVQLVTLHPAEYFGLKRRGAVAPGYIADLVVVDDLKEFHVETVLKSGQIVAQEGLIKSDIPFYSSDTVFESVHLPPLSEDSFRIEANGSKARVIGLIENQIVTRHLVQDVKTELGTIVSDPEEDVLKVAVIERHSGTGNIGLALVNGFGLKKGALASSVAHDAHNVIVVGVDDGDMVRAVQEIGRMGGGFVVVSDRDVGASLPLPVAGLMSDQPLETVCEGLDRVHQAARDLGVRLDSPFTTLSFLALPVIPELKVTDQGLVDVNTFQIVDLFE